MSTENDDSHRLYDRLNQARANNGGQLSKEEWLRIGAEQFKAVRSEERVAAGLRPKRSKRERDPLFDALAVACGVNLTEMTPTAAKTIGTALGGIRTATADVTPEEITLRVKNYRRKNPTWTVSPKAIEKHWPTLGTGRATAQAAAQDPRIAAGAPKGWQAWMKGRTELWLGENPNVQDSSAPGSFALAEGNFHGMPASWQAACWLELTRQ